MRILQVTDWNPSRGGAEEYVGWLVSALPSLGHEVALLTSSAGTAGDGHADYVALGTRWAAAQVGLQIFNPHAWIQARRARAEFRPDLAHVHLFAYHLSPAVIFSLRGVPVVVTHHDYKAGCPLGTRLLPDHRPCVDAPGPICRSGGCLGFLHWQRDRVRYRLLQRALRQAAAGVVHSRTMAGSCRALGMETVSMPLPVRPPGPSFVRAPAADPEFVCCGRLSREKGVDLLLHAFAQLRQTVPAARLTIAGDGPQRGDLEGLAAALDLGPSVRFTGWLNSVALDEVLQSTWALVAPSVWAEPFGLVAVEAILRDIPVVASRTGGLAESVVPGLSGLLFDNGQRAQLAECLGRIASGAAFPERRCQPAAVAALRQRHDPGTHLDAMVEVYRSVARSSTGAGDGLPGRPSARHRATA